MESRSFKVLVVEDSDVERALLLHIFHSDPEIEVVSVASDGEAAVEAACREKPDVVTMDIHLPQMDGLEATRQIMQRCPAPIVIISSSASYGPEGEKAFLALEAGALALGRRPPGVSHPDFAQEAQALLQTIKMMAEVKVVTQRPAQPAKPPPEVHKAETAVPIELIAIGASAGGPQALREVLAGLPRDFPVPVLIVQHMTPGFIQSFTLWLQEATGFPVHIALQGEKVQPGHAYVAPDGVHMGVLRDGTITLSDEAADDGLRPSVAHLFRSVNKAFGDAAVAVLLSGMGRDGAAEIKELKDRGAVTLVQDKESSMINGMPGEAVRLGGASYVLSLLRIPEFLVDLARNGKHHG